MAALTRDLVLAASDQKSQVIEVPEWGGSVTLRTLSGADQFKVYRCASDVDPVIVTLAYAILGDDGQRLFGDGDFDMLANKSGRVLSRLSSALNGMISDDEKDLDSAKKPSEPVAG